MLPRSNLSEYVKLFEEIRKNILVKSPRLSTNRGNSITLISLIIEFENIFPGPGNTQECHQKGKIPGKLQEFYRCS